MKIGRKELAVSTIHFVFTTITNIIVMAIVLANVSTENYAVWNVFLSIQAFVTLIDSGFGGVVLRYVSYAMLGAADISIEGVPKLTGTNEPNYKLFFEIYYYAKNIYRKFALLGLSVLIVLTGYIYYMTRKEASVHVIVLAWILFSVAVAIDMYYTYLSSVIKGMGKIKENCIIAIIVSGAAAVLKITFVLLGWGLFGLVLAYFLQLLINRILLYLYMNTDLDRYKKNVDEGFRFDKSSSTYQAIVHNSKQLTWITVADFLTGKGRTLICSTFLSLFVVGSFSASNQLIGMVYNVALLPYNVLRYKFGESIPQKDINTSRNVFSAIMIFFVVLMMGGGMAVLFLGDFVLALIHSETQMLDRADLVLLVGYQIAIGILKICTTYIQYYNEQPYTMAMVIASILSVVGAVPIMILGYGIRGYLVVLLIVQVIYNLWKWPIYSYKLLAMSFWETPKRGIKYMVHIAKGEE